jgi:hypothetical protein
MTHSPPQPTIPVACPDCLSDQVKGPDQPSTGLSYWRCLKCGIVWNPERAPERGAVRHSNARRSTRQSDNGDYWKNR